MKKQKLNLFIFTKQTFTASKRLKPRFPCQLSDRLADGCDSQKKFHQGNLKFS